MTDKITLIPLPILIMELKRHAEEFKNSTHYKEEDFNLPNALLTLCEHIFALEKKVFNL